jgi:hypothetical protein
MTWKVVDPSTGEASAPVPTRAAAAALRNRLEPRLRRVRGTRFYAYRLEIVPGDMVWAWCPLIQRYRWE